jgi:hypothetical protein
VIELRGDEPVGSMVNALHQVGDENERLSVPNKSPLPGHPCDCSRRVEAAST